MPSIPGARRNQSPPPPAERNRWWCRYPGCGETGKSQNATAARVASLNHYDRTHPRAEEGKP